MKSLALIFFLFFICSSFTPHNEGNCIEVFVLANTTWRVAGGCLENEDQTSFSIYAQNTSGDPMNRWGYFISFTDKTFKTNYRAQCGVDCFTSVTGSYKLLDNNKIEFYVEQISRSSLCGLESESPKKSFGVFFIESGANGISFTKIDR